MTRTTVYNGKPGDDDARDDVLTDVFHANDGDAAVVVQVGGSHGTELRIPEHQPVDIYVSGEEVDDE